MFSSLGWPEVAVLIVVALFVFGPERLPKMAAEAGRMLRTLRQLANNARDELKADLGPELGDLDFDSLNPRTFVRKHLFEDGDDDGGMGELKGVTDDFREFWRDEDDSPPTREVARTANPPGHRPLESGERAPYDADAT